VSQLTCISPLQLMSHETSHSTLRWTVHEVSQHVPHLVSQVAVGSIGVHEVVQSVSQRVRHDASHFP